MAATRNAATGAAGDRREATDGAATHMRVSNAQSNEQRLYEAVALILGRCYGLLRHWQRRLQRAQYVCARTLLYRVRPDDVFIVSYPKAGTTVLQMMVYQLLTDGDMGFRHIDAVVPWFDLHIGDKERPFDALTTRRAFKTHLPLSDLPRGARYIYVIREPKDSCVSYYHHCLTQMGERITLGEFVNRFLAGDVPWGSWFRHAAACATQLGRPDVLTLRYEDIVDNLPAVVRQVSDFLRCGVTPAKHAQVVERCAFAFMKAHNDKFDPRFTLARRYEADFIRKGINDGWVDELSPRWARAIDQERDVMLGRLSPSLRARYASLMPARSPDRRGTITVSALSMELSRDSARVTLSDEPLRPGDAVGVRIGLGAQGETLIERAYVTAVMPGSGGTVTELSFDELPRELWESVNECRQQGLPRPRPEHVVAGA